MHPGLLRRVGSYGAKAHLWNWLPMLWPVASCSTSCTSDCTFAHGAHRSACGAGFAMKYLPHARYSSTRDPCDGSLSSVLRIDAYHLMRSRPCAVRSGICCMDASPSKRDGWLMPGLSKGTLVAPSPSHKDRASSASVGLFGTGLLAFSNPAHGRMPVVPYQVNCR